MPTWSRADMRQAAPGICVRNRYLSHYVSHAFHVRGECGRRKGKNGHWSGFCEVSEVMDNCHRRGSRDHEISYAALIPLKINAMHVQQILTKRVKTVSYLSRTSSDECAVYGILCHRNTDGTLHDPTFMLYMVLMKVEYLQVH